MLLIDMKNSISANKQIALLTVSAGAVGDWRRRPN
jgi:hypothetical protein